MLENFKKAIFRALCLCCALIGGVNGREPNPEELLNLGMLSYDKQDFSKAKEYFEKACELNNGWGCNNLGDLYQNGEGVEKDLIKVAYFYTKACDLKDGLGCFNLGTLYLEKDSKKATTLFEKACDLNNSWGCDNLGMSYEYGQGVEEDEIKAAQLYSKACELGDQKACESLKELR
ncbi:tetratricopeptide repeat protein [Helicobacter pylori]|uniref:tetratricopeptide repeat protein n=1 Tax=Helicobacter pylori TaxID=210 RepID=UPI001AA6BD94|nr:tetratricopeptide repeat protein [Helicobacter pylori]GHR25053.1 hypothetical protein JP0094_03960 [Helicobacter pylori]